MRFLPAFVAVDEMRRGASVQQACDTAVQRIMEHVPSFALGLVCMDAQGNVTGSGHGWTFTYCTQSAGSSAPECKQVVPLGGAGGQ